jgi:hypothetical protein
MYIDHKWPWIIFIIRIMFMPTALFPYEATLPTCWSDVYHSVDATLLTCWSDVWKCQWGPVQKDRENDETNVSRPAVWKDMHFLSRRDHVGTNQISTLGKRGIYRVLSKNGWVWIHFFWSILGFPRRAQQSFSNGIYSVFSMSSFQTC